MSYSLLQVVTDGPITAPRYQHHLVKVATGALLLLGYLLAIRWLSPWMAASVCSLAWFATDRILYWLDHGGPFIKPDLWCDLSLHCTVFVPLLWYERLRVESFVLGVLLAVTYWQTHEQASP